MADETCEKKESKLECIERQVLTNTGIITAISQLITSIEDKLGEIGGAKVEEKIEESVSRFDRINHNLSSAENDLLGIRDRIQKILELF